MLVQAGPSAETEFRKAMTSVWARARNRPFGEASSGVRTSREPNGSRKQLAALGSAETSTHDGGAMRGVCAVAGQDPPWSK